MEKVKNFFNTSKGLGYVSLTLAGLAAVVSYLQTKVTNEEIINSSAEKVADMILNATNEETA